MKYKTHIEIKDKYPIISLLSEDCINNLNSRFRMHITKERVKKQIRVQRKEERPGFFDRLMRQKPGFDKGDNEKK